MSKDAASQDARTPNAANKSAANNSATNSASNKNGGSGVAGRLIRAAAALAVLLGLLYTGDWLLLRVKVSHGTAYGLVQVNQFLATPLKGNKVEYDLMDTVPVTCSRSIFPQQGDPACWWLRRHTSHWE